MKTYLSNRLRDAFKIQSIKMINKGEAILVGVEDSVRVSKAYMDKHKPEKDGYYLKYRPDGYESYCPADVFESGNTEVDPEAA